LADAHLDVLDLLEEEVLLSLPIAPKHELGLASDTIARSTEGRAAPFAVFKRN